MKKLILLFIFIAFKFSAQVSHVQWTKEIKKHSDCEYDLIFKAKIDKHWHIYSIIKAGKDGPNPTSFTFTPNSDYSLIGKITESSPHKEYDKVFEMNVASHEDKATFTQRIKLLSDKKISIKGKFESQCCDSAQCSFPPADKFNFDVQGSSACKTTASSNLNAKIDTIATANATIIAKGIRPEKDTALTTESKTKSESKTPASTLSLWAIFLAGFIGGFAALLTPCVFPMIPMNVSFFTKQSKNKKEGLRTL